jgi:hypothetical protein
VNGTTVLIAYDSRGREGGNDLGLLSSTDEGGGWTPSSLISAPEDQTHAKADGGDRGFELAWLGFKGGIGQVFHSRSMDGTTWSEPERLAGSAGAGAPGLALGTDFAHVIWSNPNMRYLRRPLPSL